MNHVKLNQARIIGQIQKSYSNSQALTTPTMSFEDFEKCQKDDNIQFFLKDVVKGYTEKVIKEGKEEAIEKAEKEFAPLKALNVVSQTGVNVVYYDAVDIEKGEYKDNSINRFLNRSGKI